MFRWVVTLVVFLVGCSTGGGPIPGAPRTGEAPWQVRQKVHDPVKCTTGALGVFRQCWYLDGRLKVTYSVTDNPAFETEQQIVPRNTFRPVSALWVDWPGKWEDEWTVDRDSWAAYIADYNFYTRVLRENGVSSALQRINAVKAQIAASQEMED